MLAELLTKEKLLKLPAVLRGLRNNKLLAYSMRSVSNEQILSLLPSKFGSVTREVLVPYCEANGINLIELLASDEFCEMIDILVGPSGLLSHDEESSDSSEDAVQVKF